MDIGALQSLLIQGPPWYQRSLMLVFVLSLVVLGLIGMVVYLWRNQATGETSLAVSADAPEESGPSEYEVVARLCSSAEGKLPQQELVEQTD